MPSGGRDGQLIVELNTAEQGSLVTESSSPLKIGQKRRGSFALVIALKSLVLHVVGRVYLKCISVANPYTNDQDLSLQRATKR